MSTQAKSLLTPEEYLEIERKAEFKSECYRGETSAMSGGVLAHNLIAGDAALLNPTLIIEVLSPSTEACDRGRKFEHYRSLESVRAYVMFASDRIHAELYTRETSGHWALTEADGLGGVPVLEAVGCRLRLVEVYEKAGLEFSQAPTAG